MRTLIGPLREWKCFFTIHTHRERERETERVGGRRGEGGKERLIKCIKHVL